MDEIIEEFFEHSFEDVVTEDMFERDYIFPQSKVEDYIMSVVSTPYQQFIDYICTHYNPKPIVNSEIPQISNYNACTTGVCQVMKFRDNPGMDCLELGKALFTDDVERKEGAFFKFGENQVKGASFHGLTHCSYKKWFLTCLGYVYPELDDELRQYLSARTLLRNPFFHIIISEANEKDVNIKKYMNGLSLSTQVRRSSSCMHFFDVILKQCQTENVSLHSIFFDKNEVPLAGGNETEKEKNNIKQIDRQRSKSKNIYVLLPNGNKIMRKNAVETFISTLQYIGLEKVSTYKERLFCGYTLVSKEERGGDYKWQKEVDGWYVYTYLSNDTKIQLLRSLSDYFHLGLMVKYEDGEEMASNDTDSTTLISSSEQLSINRLCAIFLDASSTEKFYWFISILQLCLTTNKKEFYIYKIYVRMIANAWYPIVRENLSFGYTDALGKTVVDLHKKHQIPLGLTVDEIVDLLDKRIDDKVLEKDLWRLSNNTPSKFLRPWIENEYEIVKSSQKFENGCLYAINSNYIVIEEKWRTYLRDNYNQLLDFTYRQLAKFLKLKNKKVFDLVSVLKTNNDKELKLNKGETHSYSDLQPSHYVLNTNSLSYIFNSNYDMIYFGYGKIIEINKILYKILLSVDNFVVREMKRLGKKQIVLSSAIIYADDRSPLYRLFEKEMVIEQIEDIREKNSDGKFEIKVSGEWYDSKGYLVKQQHITNPSQIKKTVKLACNSDERIIDNNTNAKDESLLIGRYIKMFPSQVVGKIKQLKNTVYGRKFVVETIEGKTKEIYDDPYKYELLSLSKVRKLLKL